MKSAVLFPTIFATLALASPVAIAERAITTVTVIVTVAPTPPFQMIRKTSTITLPSEPTNQPPPSQPQSSQQPPNQPPPNQSPPSQPQSNNNGLSSYAASIIEYHNFHRANHSVVPLTWDDELARWSKQISDTCIYGHSRKAGDGKYGQNIGAGFADEDIGSKMITGYMYNGEYSLYPGYNREPDMRNFEAWGHFSQIVWKDTRTVGCYTTHCGHLANVASNVGKQFTVCNYRPAGNILGAFKKNVNVPRGDPIRNV